MQCAVNKSKKPIYRTREGLVQNPCNPELFRHRKIGFTICSSARFTASGWSKNKNGLVSHPAKYDPVTLICRLAQHCRNGQKQARKQSIKALAGNNKYNKGDDRHQEVTEQETGHNASRGDRRTGTHGQLSDARDHFLQRVKIQERDCAPQAKAGGNAPSEVRERSNQTSCPQYDYETLNAPE